MKQADQGLQQVTLLSQGLPPAADPRAEFRVAPVTPFPESRARESLLPEPVHRGVNLRDPLVDIDGAGWQQEALLVNSVGVVQRRRGPGTRPQPGQSSR